MLHHREADERGDLQLNHELEELLGDFLSEANERLARVETTLLSLVEFPDGIRAADLEAMRRELHTLKGNSGMMGFTELQALAHTMEDRVEALDVKAPILEPFFADLDRFKKLLLEPHLADAQETSTAPASPTEREPEGRASETSIRVPLSRLDLLIDLSSELVVARTRLESAATEGLDAAAASGNGTTELWKQLDRSRLELDKILREIQTGIQKLRMVPLQPVFKALKRVVYDESQHSGKKVKLQTSGEATPLDNSLVELTNEALGHLVRNAVVHGIETPDIRRERGKDPIGLVEVNASANSGFVVIEVSDDGNGIDREAVTASAAQAGLDIRAATDPRELIFSAGLSTKVEVDRSAGRGIGLDSVVESVRRRGGSVDVEDVPGQGTRFILQLPLAVSVTEALLVEVASETYAIPAAPILETVELNADDHRRGFVEVSGLEIPLVDLHEHFHPEIGAHRKSSQGYGVLISATGRTRALVVDRPIELSEIVVHPLDDTLELLPGINGTTILGDGRVALILDTEDLTAKTTLFDTLGATA